MNLLTQSTHTHTHTKNLHQLNQSFQHLTCTFTTKTDKTKESLKTLNISSGVHNGIVRDGRPVDHSQTQPKGWSMHCSQTHPSVFGGGPRKRWPLMYCLLDCIVPPYSLLLSLEQLQVEWRKDFHLYQIQDSKYFDTTNSTPDCFQLYWHNLDQLKMKSSG